MRSPTGYMFSVPVEARPKQRELGESFMQALDLQRQLSRGFVLGVEFSGEDCLSVQLTLSLLDWTLSPIVADAQ